MARSKEGKILAVFNVKNAVYAIREADGTPGTVKPMTYMNTFSKERSPQTKDLYGDGEIQDTLVSERSQTGTIGTTARDSEFERDLGFSEEMADGEAEVALTSFKRADIGFETEVKEAGKPTKVKRVWVLNIAVKPASDSLTQNQDDITQSTADYPYTAYGVNKQDSTGTKDYVDADGHTHKVFTYSRMPGEDGYETFLETVPVPKVKAQTTGVQTQT